MKFLPHFLLLLLILIGLTIDAAAIVDDGGAAQVHPKFSSMLVGGERAVQDTAISVCGWIFACLMLLLFLSILLLGCYQPKPPSGLLVTFAFGFLICLGVFGKMWLAYQEFGRNHIGEMTVGKVRGVEAESTIKDVDSIVMLGPFPPPTSWMLFGVAFAPLVFMFVYMFGFHRWLGDPKPLQGSTK